MAAAVVMEYIITATLTPGHHDPKCLAYGGVRWINMDKHVAGI